MIRLNVFNVGFDLYRIYNEAVLLQIYSIFCEKRCLLAKLPP